MLNYLELQDLANMAAVCRKWRQMVQSHPPFALRSYREKSIGQQVSLHVERAQAERVLVNFSNRFWGAFNGWKQRVRMPHYFLETLCKDNGTPISNTLLHKTFSYLETSDKRSVEQVCKSCRVIVKENHTKEKRELLERVMHMESQAIHAWVRQFYRPSEKLILERAGLDRISKLFEENKGHWETLFKDKLLKV